MKKIIYHILLHPVFQNSFTEYLKANEVDSQEFPYNIEIIARNLNIPWAIDISNEGVIYVTERPGTIRIIKDGELLSQPMIRLEEPFLSEGEGGLLGIALDPDFSQNHYLYVYHTYSEGNQIYNRVIRLIENQDKARIDKILIDKIPGGQIHNGGRLKIGPDGMLYITTGDAGDSTLAQELSSTAGKILRINLDGSIPEDNPFPDSPVYSMGHRNPQGLTWNENNLLYASEHGPIAHDEINIIKPGANYGWPLVIGYEDAENRNTVKPLIQSGNITWAPSGITFDRQGPWLGKLLVATLRGKQLLTIILNQEGTEVVKVESWLYDDFGRLREVIQAKDGSIYLTTNNRDGRGQPDRTDDKLIRLIPKE